MNSEQTSEPSTNLSIICGKIKSQWNTTIRQWYFVWKTLRASLDKNRISSWVWQNTYIVLCGHLKLFLFASPKFGNGKMSIRSHDTRKHRALSDDEFLYWWFTFDDAPRSFSDANLIFYKTDHPLKSSKSSFHVIVLYFIHQRTHIHKPGLVDQWMLYILHKYLKFH